MDRLDFRRKILNTDKFRQAAIRFETTGRYIDAPFGSADFKRYWDEETRRCIEGYIAEDGDYITGFHYFYLNYCPISRTVYIDRQVNGRTVKRARQSLTFPSFYDYDYYYFMYIDEAQEQGKHCSVLKSRRKGYSYKGAAMLNRNYFLVPGSSNVVYASDKQFLLGDGIIQKAWDMMSFIDENTAWAKKRQKVNRELHRRASYETVDSYGNKVEAGYKSEIMGISLKSDPNKLRGKKSNLILFEEAGQFSELEEAWSIARPSVEQDGNTFGLMIAFGTGSTDNKDFTCLRKMFYSPKAYNILGVDNIWDKDAAGVCGFFIPQHTNIDLRDDDGNRLYMDSYGNTLHNEAIDYIMAKREEIENEAVDNSLIDRHIIEQPETPAEACMILSGNIFPKKDLLAHLSRIRTNKALQSSKQVGDLIRTEKGGLAWVQKKYGDVLSYNLKDGDDKKGSIVIWEHPDIDAPTRLYIAGCDPYDHDVSQTGSLGSVYIYKRFNTFEKYHDIIVAEYTGRPDTAEEYYENVRRLLEYYNARMLYENERKGLHVYFTQKNCEYLLEDTPDILNDIIGDSKVNRKKGIHMTKHIKEYGLGLIKEWLNEEISPGVKRLTTVLSEPLLEELINYNDTGNFDRVIALLLVMIYREQIYSHSVKERSEKDSEDKKFFSMNLFGARNEGVMKADFMRLNF